MATKILIDTSNEDTNQISKQTSNQIQIVCFDISQYSQNVQFCICCIGVFLFYIIYGYFQELIFSLDGFKPFGWYLTLVQFLYYTLFGYAESWFKNVSRKIPLKIYILLALLTLGTVGFSNSSLGYLNYPTQVIFKCCKLIPVLVGGMLIQQKHYGILDFIAAGLMCIGLALFTLADSHISPKFSTFGIFLISCALLCDAVIGNVQEKSMKSYQATNCEVVLYSYSIGFVYLFIIMIFNGHLQKGIAFCAKHPFETYGYAFIFSLTGYLGVQIVLTLVKTCGAFAAATVTTCRKAVTIILSFIFFAKPFSFQYLWSGLLVILGIYLNIYSKKESNVAEFNARLNKIWLLVKNLFSRSSKRSALSNV